MLLEYTNLEKYLGSMIQKSETQHEAQHTNQRK